MTIIIKFLIFACGMLLFYLAFKLATFWWKLSIGFFDSLEKSLKESKKDTTDLE